MYENGNCEEKKREKITRLGIFGDKNRDKEVFALFAVNLRWY